MLVLRRLSVVGATNKKGTGARGNNVGAYSARCKREAKEQSCTARPGGGGQPLENRTGTVEVRWVFAPFIMAGGEKNNKWVGSRDHHGRA